MFEVGCISQRFRVCLVLGAKFPLERSRPRQSLLRPKRHWSVELNRSQRFLYLRVCSQRVVNLTKHNSTRIILSALDLLAA